MKIIVVDDEETIVETVENKLRKEGFTVFTAGSAEEGMRLYRLVKPDLLVLDIMLPQRSGIELARAVRKDSSVPVIFLTAKASEDDRVAGLEIADDYIVKPFSLAEVAARVKTVLRRAGGDTPNEALESLNLRIDPRTHQAWVDGESVSLSPKEFALLYFLVRHKGQVFSREVLLDRVWGQDAYVSARTVDVHVRWLRERIEPEPGRPTRILTVRGVGYKFLG
ncbi:MAG: response regulator transcription factor [Armatimonadetes bacterium]|nr:response regulator transcription factor [Armatimonadota bacterium]MBS1710953.1 response regulator transcription factor [Armatimonadota bacterium]MBX3108625.1 response regulator transcription factor [Fimbriimonadaceae bacterium]